MTWKLLEQLRERQWAVEQAEETYRKISIHDDGESLKRVTQKLLAAKDARDNFDRQSVGRAYWRCGQAAIGEIESVNALNAELAMIAYSIFASRLAALELHESHVRSLFVGSALYQKYIHASLNLSGARNDGNDGRYLDGNLHQIAGHIFRARDLRAKLTPLLEQAKAERDAAFAVTTAPKGKTKPAA